jgi:hypothetical protein
MQYEYICYKVIKGILLPNLQKFDLSFYKPYKHKKAHPTSA